MSVLVSVTVALAGGKDQQSALPPTGIRAAYKFDETGPRFQAFGVIIRNPEKLAPLLAVGRNTGGEIAVTVPDLGKMGFMAGDKALDKLIDTTMKASGKFSAEAVTYAGPRWAKLDPNRYTCAEWLNRETKPKIAIKIESMTDWHPAKDARSGGDSPDTFNVKMTGTLAVDANTVVPVDVVGKVVFIAPRRLGESHQIRANIEMTVKGSSLGLKDKDAGDIEIKMMTVGTAKTGKELTKKVVEEGKATVGDDLDLSEHPKNDLDSP